MNSPTLPITSVAIVEDHEALGKGLRRLVEGAPGCTCAGLFSNGEEALKAIPTLQPDVVLMDIRMPGRDGVSATAEITGNPALSTRVIVLTTFDMDEYVHAALRAGASGFLLKDARPSELLAAVRTVAQGETVLAPTLLRRLVTHFVHTPSDSAPPAWVATLTPREDEVLREVARGLSNAEIGAALHMSAATAKTHVGRLLTKLDARDRTQLVVAAYEAGIVERGKWQA